MSTHRWNAVLGLFLGILTLISLIWWIPTDIETGIIEHDRYSVHIGDAMLPTVIAVLVLVLSTWLLVQSLVRWRTGSTQIEEAQKEGTTLDVESAFNLLIMTGIVCGSAVLMVWTGPALVEALNSIGFTDKSYRQLSDTAPYKFSGFALGGFVMVFGLIAWVQGHISWRAALTAFGMVTFLIVLYDVPFNSLLLPPNGSH